MKRAQVEASLPKHGDRLNLRGIDVIALSVGTGTEVSCRQCIAFNSSRCDDLPNCQKHDVTYIALDKYLIMRLKGEV